jgi:protein-disulfide isomerase
MSRLTPPVGPNEHIRGNPSAPVTLVEYGDYECPFCGLAHDVALEVLRRTSDRVRFVFRNFPNAEVHPHALQAAQTAEAAGAQGKFWPMHDLLFANQDALAPDDLLRYADELDLDIQRFTRELETGVHLEKVRADFRSGVRSGVNGTPTFFIDELRFDAAPDVETLTAAVMIAARSKAG